MTVNHDVTGSSPVRRAIKQKHLNRDAFCFIVFLYLAGLEAEAVLNDSPGDCQIRVRTEPAGEAQPCPEIFT